MVIYIICAELFHKNITVNIQTIIFKAWKFLVKEVIPGIQV